MASNLYSYLKSILEDKDSANPAKEAADTVDMVLSRLSEEERIKVANGLMKDGLLKDITKFPMEELWMFFLSELLHRQMKSIGEESIEILMRMIRNSMLYSYLKGAHLMDDNLNMNKELLDNVSDEILGHYERLYPSLTYLNEEESDEIRKAILLVIAKSANYISKAEILDMYFSALDINWRKLGGFTKRELSRLSEPYVPTEPKELKEMLKLGYQYYTYRKQRVEMLEERRRLIQEKEELMQEMKELEKEAYQEYISKIQPDIQALSPYLDILEEQFRKYRRPKDFVFDKDELRKCSIKELHAYWNSLRGSELTASSTYTAYLMARHFKDTVLSLPKWGRSKQAQRRAVKAFAVRIVPDIDGLTLLKQFVKQFIKILDDLDNIEASMMSRTKLINRILNIDPALLPF